MDKLIEQKTRNSFYVAPEFEAAFTEQGLTSVDAVFKFDGGHDLFKKNIGTYRSRLRFMVNDPPRTLFLKRYDRAPIKVQLFNWLNGRTRRTCSMCELEPILELSNHGIPTPRPVAHGQTWGLWLERRSFLVTEKIPDAESLSKRLPSCFYGPTTPESLRQRHQFLTQLAGFIRRFHDLGYNHRDLYLTHIFQDTQGKFFLIDLARAFRPIVFKRRFLVKDLAQVFYSLPSRHFSQTDRLRFYLAYRGLRRLTGPDKQLIRCIIIKANRMARHNIKHGRTVPFLANERSLIDG